MNPGEALQMIDQAVAQVPLNRVQAAQVNEATQVLAALVNEDVARKDEEAKKLATAEAAKTKKKGKDKSPK